MRKILIVLLLCLGFSFYGNSQIRLEGNFEVKVVDGNIDDVQGLKALRYLKNVYKRNTSVTKSAIQVLKYHHGKYEGDLKFLLAKSYFMDALRHKGETNRYWDLKKGWDQRGVLRFRDSWSYMEENVPDPSILENSYKTFINFYDEFRDHKLVKNKTLVSTIDRLIPKLLSHKNFELGTRKSYVQLDNLLRFGALFTYITGGEHQAITEYINKTYNAGSISLDYSIYGKKYRQHTGTTHCCGKTTENYKGYYISSRYQKLWREPKNKISLRNTAGVIFQVLVSNALHRELQYITKPELAKIDPHYGYKSKKRYLRIVELPKVASITYFPAMKVNIEGRNKNLTGLTNFLKDNEFPVDFEIHYNNPKQGNKFVLEGTFDGMCKVDKVEEFNGGVTAIPLKFGEISFPKVKLVDLIKAKHGSVYDWVGILGNDDIL